MDGFDGDAWCSNCSVTFNTMYASFFQLVFSNTYHVSWKSLVRTKKWFHVHQSLIKEFIYKTALSHIFFFEIHFLSDLNSLVRGVFKVFSTLMDSHKTWAARRLLTGIANYFRNQEIKYEMRIINSEHIVECESFFVLFWRKLILK